jgi:hypothetical protein
MQISLRTLGICVTAIAIGLGCWSLTERLGVDHVRSLSSSQWPSDVYCVAPFVIKTDDPYSRKRKYYVWLVFGCIEARSYVANDQLPILKKAPIRKHSGQRNAVESESNEQLSIDDF